MYHPNETSKQNYHWGSKTCWTFFVKNFAKQKMQTFLTSYIDRRSQHTRPLQEGKKSITGHHVSNLQNKTLFYGTRERKINKVITEWAPYKVNSHHICVSNYGISYPGCCSTRSEKPETGKLLHEPLPTITLQAATHKMKLTSRRLSFPDNRFDTIFGVKVCDSKSTPRLEQTAIVVATHVARDIRKAGSPNQGLRTATRRMPSFILLEVLSKKPLFP